MTSQDDRTRVSYPSAGVSKIIIPRCWPREGILIAREDGKNEITLVLRCFHPGERWKWVMLRGGSLLLIVTVAPAQPRRPRVMDVSAADPKVLVPPAILSVLAVEHTRFPRS